MELITNKGTASGRPPASDEELARVEKALEKREAARERLFTAPSAGPDIDISNIGSTVSR